MSRRRSRGHKGYSSPMRFIGGRSTSTYSTQQLLLVVALVAGGVSLLTWFLSSAKGAW